MRIEYKSWLHVPWMLFVVVFAFGAPYMALHSDRHMSDMQIIIDRVYADLFVVTFVLTAIISSCNVHSHNAEVDEVITAAKREEAKKLEDNLISALEEL